MSELFSKIADSELEVLKLLWRSERKMTMPEIRKTLEPTTGWQSQTIKTLLYRLCDKGVVKAERQDIYYYSAIVSEKEYNNYAATSLIDKLFDGSAMNLVASLIDGRNLNDNDINELSAMFNVSREKK